jgi:hypothetical protein
MNAAKCPPGTSEHCLQGITSETASVDREQIEEIVNSGSGLEGQSAIHVGLGGHEIGIEEQVALQLGITKPHYYLWPAIALPEGVTHAQVRDDDQTTLFDEAT